MQFTPAKKDKISMLIIRQIRSAILSGKLPPGSALPPEKDLITQFSVSKHTLREALRTLEGMGLLSIRRGAGGGPVVQEIDWQTARESFNNFLYFQDITLENLTEVRMMLEPCIARRAATMLTAEATEELCKVHEECEVLYRQDKTLVGAKAEILFHVLLAKYTNNHMLWIILDFINNTIADIKLQYKPGKDFCRKVLEAHRKILHAILTGDADNAEKYMYDHICEVGYELRLLMAQHPEMHTQSQMPFDLKCVAKFAPLNTEKELPATHHTFPLRDHAEERAERKFPPKNIL